MVAWASTTDLTLIRRLRERADPDTTPCFLGSLRDLPCFLTLDIGFFRDQSTPQSTPCSGALSVAGERSALVPCEDLRGFYVDSNYPMFFAALRLSTLWPPLRPSSIFRGG